MPMLYADEKRSQYANSFEIQTQELFEGKAEDLGRFRFRKIPAANTAQHYPRFHSAVVALGNAQKHLPHIPEAMRPGFATRIASLIGQKNRIQAMMAGMLRPSSVKLIPKATLSGELSSVFKRSLRHMIDAFVNHVRALRREMKRVMVMPGRRRRRRRHAGGPSGAKLGGLFDFLGLSDPLSPMEKSGMSLGQIFARFSNMLAQYRAKLPQIPRGSVQTTIQNQIDSMNRLEQRLGPAFIPGAVPGSQDRSALGDYVTGVKKIRKAISDASDTYGLRISLPPELPTAPAPAPGAPATAAVIRAGESAIPPWALGVGGAAFILWLAKGR